MLDCYLKLKWITHLISKIDPSTKVRPMMHIDNKGLDDKIKKFGSHSKSRQIDIKTKGLCEDFSLSKFNLILIATEKMIADPLTKATSVGALKLLQQNIFTNSSDS